MHVAQWRLTESMAPADLGGTQLQHYYAIMFDCISIATVKTV